MQPRSAIHPWLMLGPSLCVWAFFVALPLFVTAYESFFAWDMLTPHSWVGLENYADLGAEGELVFVAARTLLYSAGVVTGAIAFGLSLAMLLNRPGGFFSFVRTAVFGAYVMSWVAVALVWTFLLDPDRGLLASLAGRWVGHGLFGGSGLLGSPRWALATLAAVTVWKIAGYAMVLFLTGLRAVPSALYESAMLDGAGAWARFRHVTWPLLRPTATFVATTSLVGSFQAFDVVRIMTQGGPAHTTTLFVYAIYERIFIDLSVGRASALAMAYFVSILALALLQLWAWRSAKQSTPS